MLTAMLLVSIPAAFVMGRDWDDFRAVLTRRKRRAAVRLSAALIAIAAALTLTGCAAGDYTPAADQPACYPPLACGAFYPVPYYPWAYHPYIGYLHDPAHVIITGAGPRTTVVYRPYSPPLQPVFIKPPRTPAKAAPAPAKAPTVAKAPAVKVPTVKTPTRTK